MILNTLLKSEKLTKTQKSKTVDKLFEDSTPNYDFFLMLILSAIIVALGLLANNLGIIIGGMLVAPILSPILSFSMGIVVGRPKLMKRSGLVIVESIIVVTLISFGISLLSLNHGLTTEITNRAYPSLIYFLIALFSGAAVAYALVRPCVSEVLPGVAISVSLLPPLAVVGIAVAFLNWSLAIGAFSLFVLNLLGITFAALVVFAIFRFYEVRESIDKKIRAEERTIKDEMKEKQIEKIEEIERVVKEAAELIKETKR